jgi:hypothetical protein
MDSPPSPSGDRGRGDRKNRFVQFWTTLPGVLTGVAAVLTALVAVVGVVSSSGGGGKAGPAPTEVRPELGTTGTAQPTTAEGPEHAGEPLRGHLSLSRNDHADLEAGRIGLSPTTDVSFGPQSTPNIFADNGAFLAPTEGAPDKEACVRALTARRDAFEVLPELADGSGICVNMAQGHVPSLRRSWCSTWLRAN